MARRVCELANAECKYYEREPMPELRGQAEHGCYSDENHIVPQRLGRCAISRAFIQLPENREQICRNEHDKINDIENATGEPLNPLPPMEDMIDAVVQHDGNVSRSVRKQIAQEQRHIMRQQQRVMNNFWSNMQERRA